MKNIKRMVITSVISCLMIISMAIPTFAAAPQKEKVKYEGNGKVEVEYVGHVNYKNSKITVKDTSGKKYNVTVLERDDDETIFKIKNYKAGKTYKFTISGVKQSGTSGYGKVTGSVKIPKASSSITRAKAKTIAKNKAQDKWNVSLNKDYMEVESDHYDGKSVWEVNIDKGNYEYEFEIQKSNGKVLRAYRELDD